MKEAGSSSSSLLRSRGTNVNIVNSSRQAQAEGSHGPSSSHCDQAKASGESSSLVLEHIIFFYERMGHAIAGKEMELLSFLVTKNNQQRGEPTF